MTSPLLKQFESGDYFFFKVLRFFILVRRHRSFSASQEFLS